MKKEKAKEKEEEKHEKKGEEKTGGIKNQKQDMEAFWHSSSHILADAVKRLRPDARLGIGPAIAEGFYYDFDTQPFTPQDFEKIEKLMHEIASQKLNFENVFLERKEAEKLLEKEPYKLELLKEIEGKKISFYKHGNFIDLCAGPLIKNSEEIKVIKLLNTASAYWKGDSSRQILQRIYGTSFSSQNELNEFLKKKEEAEKRDHVKIGRQLELFEIFPEVGAALIHWLPKGAMIRRIIEDFWKAEHDKRNYQYVYTPHIGKIELWKTSGHWDFYRHNMYPPMKIDNIEYILKPMNCPFHVQIYKMRQRSYKELPIKYCELGTVYRPELGGVLHGLVRVRTITQDDAHIFCMPEQLEQEIKDVLEFGLWMIEIFGFKDYIIEFSVRDPKQKKKWIGSDDIWNIAEKALVSVLEKKRLKYTRMEGEAAFYGPKIDVHLLDALGRKWQCLTIQIDFNFPEKFDLEYVGEDNKKHRVVMIHRALLGAIERFFGCLIEHYAGAFPTWLSPAQIKLLTLTERNKKYAQEIEKKFLDAEFRVETDYSAATIEYKIREAQLQKVPYVVVIGDKEEKNKTLAIRTRDNKVRYGIKTEDFISELKKEIEDKR